MSRVSLCHQMFKNVKPGIGKLFLVSLFVAMVSTVPTVSAVNETSSGTITGTETWTGVMNMDGDLLVAGGAKLIINAGTTSTFLLTNPFVSKAQFVLEIHLVVLLKPVPVLQSDSSGVILQPCSKPNRSVLCDRSLQPRPFLWSGIYLSDNRPVTNQIESRYLRRCIRNTCRY